MFKTAKRILKSNGYSHYEIANFSKPGFEANHNYCIWKDNEYLGLGASAYSRFQNQHFNNVFSIENYIRLINSKQDARENIEEITLKDQLVEHVLLRLRIKDGINLSEFQNKFGKSIFEIFNEQINKLSELRLLKVTRDRINLTSKGMDLENLVGLEFV
jgi:oxygen-independent coproporphyrinogen-3 oxidase